MTGYPVRGLLFDCDGVLVDSDDAAAEAWNSWALTWAPGFDFHRDIVHGRPARETIAELVPAADVARADHALLLREVETAPLTRDLPGAFDLLTTLPTAAFTIVTSAAAPVAAARLAAAGLPRPASIVTFDQVQRGKPAPDPYRLGAQRLGLPPEHIVVFEDAEAGIISARAAGIGLLVGIGPRGRQTSAHVALNDLRGIRFDGARLELDAEHATPPLVSPLRSLPPLVSLPPHENELRTAQ